MLGFIVPFYIISIHCKPIIFWAYIFLIWQDENPTELKREKKQQAMRLVGNTFEALAREWFDKQEERWTENHAHRVMTSLEKGIFPFIGNRPIDQITTPEMLEVLKKVEKRDALDVAKRLKQRCGSVFSYARQIGKMTAANPVSDLARVLKTRKQVHRQALSKTDLPEFLDKLDIIQAIL